MSIDFYKVLTDCNSYNTVILIINCFGKRPISLPYKKTINAKGAARLYINFPYRIYRLPDTIVLDCGL